MMADVTPMDSMNPITVDTLFETLPAPGPVGTDAAPIGAIGYTTFRPNSPVMPGTILGPLGQTVPSSLSDSVAPNSGLGATVADALLTGNGAGESPAASSPAQAAATGLPAGPQTFLPLLPSMVYPKNPVVSIPQSCGFSGWVQANPVFAGILGAFGAYFLLRGGNK